MKANGVSPDEMTYTALARAAAVSGNPDRAYQLVRVVPPGLIFRLRANQRIVPTACTGEGHAQKWSFAEAANIHARIDSLLRQPQPQQRACKRCLVPNLPRLR